MEVLFIELESLIIDASGIDFEKLLETVNVDDLLKGFTHESLIEKYAIIKDKDTDKKEEDQLEDEEIEYS